MWTAQMFGNTRYHNAPHDISRYHLNLKGFSGQGQSVKKNLQNLNQIGTKFQEKRKSKNFSQFSEKYRYIEGYGGFKFRTKSGEFQNFKIPKGIRKRYGSLLESKTAPFIFYYSVILSLHNLIKSGLLNSRSLSASSANSWVNIGLPISSDAYS